MIYIYIMYIMYMKITKNIKTTSNFMIEYPDAFNASSGASPWAELLVLDPTREGTAKQPWFCGVDVCKAILPRPRFICARV